MKNRIFILILNIIPISSLCYPQLADSKPDTTFMLNHDMKGIAKPKDMLQRNCTDCHKGDMNVRMYLMAISDTNQSGDKITHSWLTYTTNDSLKEIQILAQGINRLNDTVPLRKVMLLVLARKYFGWMPVITEPIFTDDFGKVVYKSKGELDGDDEGNVKLLIKLVDVRSYPNAKIRLNKKWGITDLHKSKSEGGNISLWHNQLFIVLSIIFVLGIIITSFLLISVIHMTSRIKREAYQQQNSKQKK